MKGRGNLAAPHILENEDTYAPLGGTSIFSLNEVIYKGANW